MTSLTETEIDNRIVHAKYNGVEVVRYEDEWFLEPTIIRPFQMFYGASLEGKVKELKEKKKVSLKEAAISAAEGVMDAWQPSHRAWPSGFQVFFGQEGGEEFDEIVKEKYPILYPQIQYVDLGNGHEFMGIKCPGCEEWLQIGDTQIGGGECIDHRRGVDGGCGFHGYIMGRHAGYIVDLGDVIKEKNAK